MKGCREVGVVGDLDAYEGMLMSGGLKEQQEGWHGRREA